MQPVSTLSLVGHSVLLVVSLFLIVLGFKLGRNTNYILHGGGLIVIALFCLGAASLFPSFTFFRQLLFGR